MIEGDFSNCGGTTPEWFTGVDIPEIFGTRIGMQLPFNSTGSVGLNCDGGFFGLRSIDQHNF